MPKVNAKADSANETTGWQGKEFSKMQAPVESCEHRDAPENTVENKGTVKAVIRKVWIKQRPCQRRHGEQRDDNGQPTGNLNAPGGALTH